MNILDGYIADHYYLSLDEEIEPCVAKHHVDKKGLLDVINEKLVELTWQAEQLGEKKQELNEKAKEVATKEQLLCEREKLLKIDKYGFYCDILRSGHCKEEYVKQMGVEFWEENLKRAISAGGNIGINEQKVKQDVSYAMVSIYEDLQEYDKAYDFFG